MVRAYFTSRLRSSPSVRAPGFRFSWRTYERADSRRRVPGRGPDSLRRRDALRRAGFRPAGAIRAGIADPGGRCLAGPWARRLGVVAWEGAGLTFEEDAEALSLRAVLPRIPAADLALDGVRSGRRSGLSIEFRSLEERQEDGLRVIARAALKGVGLVRGGVLSRLPRDRDSGPEDSRMAVTLADFKGKLRIYDEGGDRSPVRPGASGPSGQRRDRRRSVCAERAGTSPGPGRYPRRKLPE